MADYEPLDLTKWCNTEATVLDEDEDVAVGRQTFRGLPFMVGPEDGNLNVKCFIALSGSDDSITVPIGERAHRIIFAHRLLETSVPQGDLLGVHVAEYSFHLAGGKEASVPIRERFEIAAMAGNKGVSVAPGLPYRAATDQKFVLMPRYEGPWDQLGRRQMESTYAWPRFSGFALRQWYYLWAWKNPEPERTIEAVKITPGGPRFIIAAITLGHLDEDPFAREGRRPARIVLTDPNDAQEPFDLDVEVDRGDTTYVHPLPEASAKEYVSGSYRGWGQEQNGRSSPAYVEISATPSATVRVKQGGEEIGEVNWGEVEEKGLVETPRMRFELIDHGKNWVHVTVLDEDTGRPVPCRVHFRSPEGVPFQPHGHHNHVNSNLGSWNIDVGGDVRLGQTTYAYIDGRCQGWLPRGEVTVDVARGFEYEPLRTNVTIEPGQRELTLRIKRWIDMNERRWFSGDSHVHFLSTQGAHAESQGEDLNVVNLLQSQWGSLFTNTEDFTGSPSVAQAGNNIVYVGQENRQHFLGHMILWGLKNPVMPWCSDGPSEAEMGGSMETTLSDWADRCHAQGGYVINPHFPYPNGEPAALIATGRVDGIEMIGQSEFMHNEYYRYLNCGYRLPLVGGTDKMTADVPVGIYRTYVHLPEEEEFSYESWCRNVARGRTFLSGGPIVHLTVDGYEIGDTVRLSGAGTVEVEAWAESIFPLHRLDIVQAGRVVASAESRSGTRRLELKEKLKVDSHTWLAARCGGPEYWGHKHFDGMGAEIYAHTSPIYVACGGDWWMFNKGTAQYMLTLIEGDLDYIDNHSGQHTRGNVTHHHGEDDHMGYLRRPFLQAQESIHSRARAADVDL